MIKVLNFDIDDLFTPTDNKKVIQEVAKQSEEKFILTGEDIDYIDWLWQLKCVDFLGVKFDIEADKIPLDKDVSPFIERLTYILNSFREAQFSKTLFYFEKDKNCAFADPVIQSRYDSPNMYEERHWQFGALFSSNEAFLHFVLVIFHLLRYMNENREGMDQLYNNWYFAFFPLTTSHDRTRINFEEFANMLDGRITYPAMFSKMQKMLEILYSYTSTTEEMIEKFYYEYHARKKTVQYRRPVLGGDVAQPYRNYQKVI